MYAPSQWETTLQCNVVCYWLGACTERSRQSRTNRVHFLCHILQVKPNSNGWSGINSLFQANSTRWLSVRCLKDRFCCYLTNVCCVSRIILDMGSANDRWRLIATSSLIDGAHIQNDLCVYRLCLPVFHAFILIWLMRIARCMRDPIFRQRLAKLMLNTYLNNILRSCQT